MNSMGICVFSLLSKMFLIELAPPIVMTSWAADGDDYKLQKARRLTSLCDDSNPIIIH